MPNSDDLAVALAHLGMLRHNPTSTIRPLLLRVVVDLFLHKRHHAPDDIRTFEAMVTPLLDDVDAATRRVLVDRLFDHPATPAAVLDRLMDAESQIGAEVYRHASFAEAELLAIAETGPAMTAATVAQRPDLPPDVITALVERPEPRIAQALADNAAVVLAPSQFQALVRRARTDRDLAERLAAREGDPLATAPLFALVSPRQRRRIVDAVRRHELGRRPWGRPDRATVATLERLDRLVLGGEWDVFEDTLCLALGERHRALRPLLRDGTGDILALALAAVGATADLAARVFILGDPAIGRSVSAVRRLTTMVDTLAPAAARRLLEAIVEAVPNEERRPSSPTPPSLGARRGNVAADVTAVRRERVEPARRARR